MRPYIRVNHIEGACLLVCLKDHSVMLKIFALSKRTLRVTFGCGGFVLEAGRSSDILELVSLLVSALSAVSTKDYIRAEQKHHSIFKLFISQVMFFESVYIPRALNTGTCIHQGDLFYSAGLYRNRC